MLPKTAVIFDMDGVLFDSERLSMRFWQQAASERGWQFPEEVFTKMIGRTVEENEPMVCAALGEDFPYWEVRARRTELFKGHLEDVGPPVKPGVYQALERLQAGGIPVGVATSTARQEAEQLLGSADILPHLQALVGGDQVPLGKPAPDIYIAAAEKMGVAPAACVALEDSGPGIRAAYSAGMTVVAVPDLAPLDPFELTCARNRCRDLEEALPILIELVLGSVSS